MQRARVCGNARVKEREPVLERDSKLARETDLCFAFI